jgi:ubiquinone/menaquinone biosynthesis C-methylase UbiE
MPTAEALTKTPPLSERQVLTLHQRLRAVYQFAKLQIKNHLSSPVEKHLDVGTYKGTFLNEILKFADGIRVFSFDMDDKRLSIAQQDENLKPAFATGKLHLGQMKAQKIAFASNSFDSATIVEVFGAGFEGDPTDVEQVLREVYRTLKPGGVLVMTVRSASAEEVLEPISDLDNRGLAVSRKSLKPLLTELFGENVEWYGQVILKHNGKSLFRKFREETPKLMQKIMKKSIEKNVPIPGVIYEAAQSLANIIDPKEPHYGLSLPTSIDRDKDHIGHAHWDRRAFRPRKIPDLNKETPGYWVCVCQKPLEQTSTPLENVPLFSRVVTQIAA